MREWVYQRGGLVLTNSYIFTYKDHLGNIRVKYRKSGQFQLNPFITESTDYYPFGLAHQPLPVSVDGNKYKYNGKEWQDELGLNLYDYGWR